MNPLPTSLLAAGPGTYRVAFRGSNTRYALTSCEILSHFLNLCGDSHAASAGVIMSVVVATSELGAISVEQKRTK